MVVEGEVERNEVVRGVEGVGEWKMDWGSWCAGKATANE